MTNVSNASLTLYWRADYDYPSGSVPYKDSCPAAYRENAIHWHNLNPALAITWSCWTTGFGNGTEMFSFQITFDASPALNGSPYRWYSGTGTSLASDQYDFYSVASHEFGHATFQGAY